MHDDLHWLTVPQRLQYKFAVTVHRCLQYRALRHLADYCVPVSEVPGRQHLRSVSRRQLSVPRVHRSMCASRRLFCRRTNSLEFTARWFVWSPVDSKHIQRDFKTHPFTGHCGSFVH